MNDTVLLMQLRAAEERIQTLSSANSYMESLYETQKEIAEKKTEELSEYKAAINDILNQALGDDWERIQDKDKNNWSAKKKGLFIIMTHQAKIMSRHHIIHELENHVGTLKVEIESIKEASLQETREESAGNKQQEKGPISYEELLAMKRNENTGMIEEIASEEKTEAPPEVPCLEAGESTIPPRVQNSAPAISVTGGHAKSSLTDVQKEIVQAIGETGDFLIKDITEMLQLAGVIQGQMKLHKDFNELEKKAVLHQMQDKISIGTGRSPNIFLLSTRGEKYYQDILEEKGLPNKPPRKSKYYDYVEQAKSPEHGAMIEQVETRLKEVGFKTSREVRVKTPIGDSICDVLAQEGGLEFHIEVECGNYTDDMFEHKIQKILAYSKEVYFVTKNAGVKDRLLKLVNFVLIDKYGSEIKNIEQFRKKEGGIVSIITFEEFKSKKCWPKELN
ncbi:hypothetical protein [Anaeromusa acidaminophila]|uniref:hypothetical protein n=1 Tax=Anaeromusa acidaminophila TaxID=81464 RepID=UPI000372E201|nr:hypothetical protein [Anaeromusa acidaminophila]